MSKKKVAIIGGNPKGDGTMDAFKKDLAQRMAEGKNSAIVIGDDGNAKIVDIDAVKEQREIRTAGIAEIKRMLKPMPVEVRKVGNNRNLPCPCGSGRKFKKCCFYKDEPITIEP